LDQTKILRGVAWHIVLPCVKTYCNCVKIDILVIQSEITQYINQLIWTSFGLGSKFMF
jgi:hypothetical protein